MGSTGDPPVRFRYIGTDRNERAACFQTGTLQARRIPHRISRICGVRFAAFCGSQSQVSVSSLCFPRATGFKSQVYSRRLLEARCGYLSQSRLTSQSVSICVLVPIIALWLKKIVNPKSMIQTAKITQLPAQFKRAERRCSRRGHPPTGGLVELAPARSRRATLNPGEKTRFRDEDLSAWAQTGIAMARHQSCSQPSAS